jgi:hypothetical protein
MITALINLVLYILIVGLILWLLIYIVDTADPVSDKQGVTLALVCVIIALAAFWAIWSNWQ